MIGEIALLIKGLDTACKLVRTGLDRKKDLEEMGGEISSFFASKEAVEEKIAEVKKKNKTYNSTGSALEEAIQIEQQAQKIEDMMSRIGKEYSRQGKSHKWAKVKKDAANIQKNRDFKMAAANRKKILQDKQDDEFYLVIKLVSGLVILMIGLTGFVLLVLN
tara:strand:- start:2661 stop:3146 length:486 start_codon:yes stop_codon:yes gene_type:complete